jgi:copper chaperone CopZ
MDLAQQVGYLQGMQEATQRELVSIRGELSEVKADVADLKGDVAEVKTDVADLNRKLDEVLATLRSGSGGHPTLKDPGVVNTILRNPATPVFAALLLVVVMAIVMVSALSGRSANDLVPAMPSAPGVAP